MNGLLSRPNGIAVETATASETFSQLEEKSRQIYLYLRHEEISVGDIVVVFAHKSIDYILAVIGVAKSGATFLPLNPELPSGRLRQILEQSNPILIIGLESDCQRCVGLSGITYNTMCYGDLQIGARTNRQWRQLPTEPVLIRPSDICYIIYTSGSTGEPKGVMISHGSISAYFEGVGDLYSVTPRSKCINTVPYYFDASMCDTFFPLYQGASIYITPSLPIPTIIFGVIQRKKITHITMTNRMLRILSTFLAELSSADISSLEILNIGGEFHNNEDIDLFFSKVPNLKMVNGYGPTEVSCECIVFIFDRFFCRKECLPIGRPLKYVDAKLVDNSIGLSSEPGAKGELVLSGPQLFSGYLKRNELTDQVITTYEGRPYYHTGDYCKITTDGNYVWLGRIDDEIKIGGQRFHINELRSKLENYFSEIDLFEVLHYKAGLTELIALAIEYSGDPSEQLLFSVRNFLGTELEEKFLPKIVLFYRELPLLPSQKTDIKKINQDLATAAIEFGGEGSFYFVDVGSIRKLQILR